MRATRSTAANLPASAPCATANWASAGIPKSPHLAGQPALYLEKSLNDYKTGKRKDRRMTLMVKPLSKADIKDLAAWYESLKIEVKAPEPK